MTTRRIHWDDIVAYARRFAEYEIVQAIRPNAETIHVPIDRLTARRLKGTPLQRFGPLATGASLDPAWRIEGIGLASDTVRVKAVRADGVDVTFAASPNTADAPRSPFDAGALHISYEQTKLPFAEFAAAGRALRDALVASEAATAWRRWIAEAAGFGSPKVATRQLPDADRLEVRADGKLYLRITDSCQERCLFCFFYDTDEIDNLVRHHDLGALIANIDPSGIRQVILTGGEPTLHPQFHEYVAKLYDLGFAEIIVQTNGVRFSEPGYLERLLPYKSRLGLGFSLHSATEATNDALTTVHRGLFARKLEAIRQAASMGFRSKITLVLNRLNLDELTRFIELCKSVTEGADTFLQFSLPSFEGRMNLFLDTYPRLEEIARALPPALRRARELDVRVALCHQCQVPPCIVPDDVQHLESLWFGETPGMWSHDRAYGPQCGSCAMRPWCSGVWKGYADNFGTSALTPFTAEEIEPRSAKGGA